MPGHADLTRARSGDRGLLPHRLAARSPQIVAPGAVGIPSIPSLGYPFNRSCPTPLFSTGDSLEDAPGSAGADAPAAALAGLFEVDGWR